MNNLILSCSNWERVGFMAEHLQTSCCHREQQHFPTLTLTGTVGTVGTVLSIWLSQYPVQMHVQRRTPKCTHLDNSGACTNSCVRHECLPPSHMQRGACAATRGMETTQNHLLITRNHGRNETVRSPSRHFTNSTNNNNLQ